MVAVLPAARTSRGTQAGLVEGESPRLRKPRTGAPWPFRAGGDHGAVGHGRTRIGLEQSRPVATPIVVRMIPPVSRHLGTRIATVKASAKSLVEYGPGRSWLSRLAGLCVDDVDLQLTHLMLV